MTNTRKVQLLCQKAKGQGMSATPAEIKELKKYKVSAGDASYATQANIRAYVNAVDSGYFLSFYDYCQNNHKGDRRRKGHSAKEMASQNRWDSVGVMMFGWLFWGIAIYWTAGERFSAGTCAIAGAVLSVFLLRMNRRLAGFTLFLLPIIIAAIAFNI